MSDVLQPILPSSEGRFFNLLIMKYLVKSRNKIYLISDSIKASLELWYELVFKQGIKAHLFENTGKKSEPIAWSE